MKKLQLVLVLMAACVGAGNTKQQESGFLLVSLNADRQVAFVDPRTQKVVAKLPSPAGPHEIAVTRDQAIAYVADTGTGPGGTPGDSIVVFDLKTRARKTTLKACESPHDARVSRDGRLLWVACAPMKAVLELDAKSGAVLKTWNTNLLGGWFVEVTPDERKLYVPHLEEKALSVIDRTTGQVRTVISGTTQFGVAVSPNGREVWVSDADENKLSIIDTSNDRVTTTISLGDAVKGQSSFSRLQFTPDGQYVVIVSKSKFSSVDAKRRTILWSVNMPHEGKVVTISSDNRRAYVSHPGNDRVSVINLATQKIENTFVVGKQPDGIAWVD